MVITELLWMKQRTQDEVSTRKSRAVSRVLLDTRTSGPVMQTVQAAAEFKLPEECTAECEVDDMFFVTAGATDQTIDIFLQDSSSATGGGLTGLTNASSGLTCYFRKGATGTVTQLTLASQTVGGAHTDGGFVELDSTNAPGTYRLDLSDAMVSAEGTLTIYLHGATNLLQTPIRVHVASATRGYAGTALPAAAKRESSGRAYSRNARKPCPILDWFRRSSISTSSRGRSKS